MATNEQQLISFHMRKLNSDFMLMAYDTFDKSQDGYFIPRTAWESLMRQYGVKIE
jgi:hypothetical protein